MKRITPEEVLDAYAKTGLKPRRCATRPFFGECCAIGALATQDGDRYPTHWANSKYGWLYVASFMHGFDGFPNIMDGSAEGHADGLAAAQAVFQGS